MSKVQLDREAYDMLLKECLKDMGALRSDKEREDYIFKAYNDGKITMELCYELTEIHHSTLRMIQESIIAEKV
jgi:hypothetical protein